MTEKQTHILAVDDQPDNLLILESLLEDSHTVHTVQNGQQALDFFAHGHHADLILLDVMMPVLDGFETCRRLKAMPQTRDIPVLFITGLESAADEEYGLTLGAEDFIHKPFVPAVVMARVRNHLRLSQATQELKLRNDDLEEQVMERTREIVRQADELMRQKQSVIAAQDATILSFRLLAGTRDNETGSHIARTQNYLRVLADQLRRHARFSAVLNEETIFLMYKSSALHDIGKVGIPDAVLHKPGKLNAEEWEIMKQHCVLGRDAIVASEELSFLTYAREIAYTHHERWDGTGYPQGLKGEDIPLSGRLMAVADVYDALISRRVYKSAFSHQQSVAIMFAERGKQFDPDILDAMLEISETFRAIALQYNEGER